VTDNARSRLAIIADGTSRSRNEFLDRNTDVLVFSISNLSDSLEEHLNIEDFLSRDEWNEVAPRFEANFLLFLQSCDAEARAFTHDYSFTDSGFWILHRFSNLYFLHRLAEKLIKKYNEFTIFAPVEFEYLNIQSATFEDPNFKNLGSGLIACLQYLAYALPNTEVVKKPHKKIFLRNQSATRRWIGNIAAGFKRGTLTNDLRDYCKRLAMKRALKFENASGFDSLFLIGESGYDVEHVKGKYPNEKFVVFNYAKALNGISGAKQSNMGYALEKIATSYLTKELPLFKQVLLKFFESYIKEMVLNLGDVRKSIAKELKELRPKSLIFSTGATNILERTLCREANQLGIPIFFLRHAGIELNFLDTWLLDDFCEHDLSIPRTQLLINEYERTRFPHDSNISYIANGCAHLCRPLRHTKTLEDRILYSSGPPAHFSFKRPTHMITDRERSLVTKELIRAASSCNLGLDIKLHPAEIESSYQFFKAVTNNSGHADVVLYSAGGIQQMLLNYNLVVIDIIATHVFHLACYFEKEVILFLPEGFSNCNDETFQDLQERVHLARQPHEINSLVKLFADGALIKKADNKTFNKKYFGDRSYNQIIDVSFETITLR
jgi:hypothetical protein